MTVHIFHAKNAELVEILAGIKSAIDGKVLLPVSISYKIVKNKIAIEQALSAYRVTKDEIINRISDGQGYIDEKESPEKFKKLCQELAIISAEYTDVEISKITLDELGDRELPLDMMAALGFMME